MFVGGSPAPLWHLYGFLVPRPVSIKVSNRHRHRKTTRDDKKPTTIKKYRGEYIKRTGRKKDDVNKIERETDKTAAKKIRFDMEMDRRAEKNRTPPLGCGVYGEWREIRIDSGRWRIHCVRGGTGFSIWIIWWYNYVFFYYCINVVFSLYNFIRFLYHWKFENFFS